MTRFNQPIVQGEDIRGLPFSKIPKRPAQEWL
jgi:hypothetical protein